MSPRRRAAAGIVLGAAGMIASRFRERREEFTPAPVPDPAEAGHSTEEVERARAELAEELARRTERADNAPE